MPANLFRGDSNLVQPKCVLHRLWDAILGGDQGSHSFLEAIGGTNTSFIHQLEINFIRSSSQAECRRALGASRSLSSLIHLNAIAIQSLILSLPTMNLTAHRQKFMSVRSDGLAEIFYEDRCERRTFAKSYDTLPQPLNISLRAGFRSVDENGNALNDTLQNFRRLWQVGVLMAARSRDQDMLTVYKNRALLSFKRLTHSFIYHNGS